MPSVSFRGRFTRHKRHNMAVEYITLRDERKALAVRMWQVSSDTFLGVGSAESNVTWDVLRFMKCVINSDHTHGEKYANAAQIAGWGALAIPREGGITFCRSFSRCLRMWFFCQQWARGNLFDFIDLLNQQIIFQQLNMAPILCIFFHVLIHTGCWSSDFSCTAKHWYEMRLRSQPAAIIRSYLSHRIVPWIPKGKRMCWETRMCRRSCTPLHRKLGRR